MIINFFFLIIVIDLLYILLCLGRQPLYLRLRLFILIIDRAISKYILFLFELINYLGLVIFTFIDIFATSIIISLYNYSFIFIYFFNLFSYYWRLTYFYWTAYFIFIQYIFPFRFKLKFIFAFLLFFRIFNFKFFINVLSLVQWRLCLLFNFLSAIFLSILHFFNYFFSFFNYIQSFIFFFFFILMLLISDFCLFLYFF